MQLTNITTYSSINNGYQNSLNVAFQKKHKKNTSPISQKTIVATSAFVGAILPVVAMNSLKKGRLDNVINSFKNKLPIKEKLNSINKILEIESFSQILATTTGGVLGGLVAGVKTSKTKEEKEAKYKEGIFEFLNNMTPTALVGLGLSYSKKTGKFNSIGAKCGLIAGSVALGMFIANKTSNFINKKLFNKNDKENNEEKFEKRKFKLSDCLVHCDDLLNIAVLTKIPLASKLQMDKILPLIYAKSGYEVGVAQARHQKHKNREDKNKEIS